MQRWLFSKHGGFDCDQIILFGLVCPESELPEVLAGKVETSSFVLF